MKKLKVFVYKFKQHLFIRPPPGDSCQTTEAALTPPPLILGIEESEQDTPILSRDLRKWIKKVKNSLFVL